MHVLAHLIWTTKQFLGKMRVSCGGARAVKATCMMVKRVLRLLAIRAWRAVCRISGLPGRVLVLFYSDVAYWDALMLSLRSLVIV